MRILSIILFLVASLYAKSDKLSPLPLPNSFFINLNPTLCDEKCLKKYLEQKRYFSFLAAYSHESNNSKIINSYNELTSLFFIPSSLPNIQTSADTIKIAVLVPQRTIQRYSITSVNSIISYLFTRGEDFEVRVFNSYDETEESLTRELDNIRRAKFQFVIAPLTPQGANFVARNSENLLVYIPTIHSSLMQNTSNNIIYGGIDYKEQIEKLSHFSNGKIAVFSDGSLLGEKLNLIVEDVFMGVGYKGKLTGSRLNLKPMIKSNKRLEDSSIFLNTPLVKSSLIASQLRAYDIEPYTLLSTQINYHPMLINLTQYDDRKKLYLANSIQETSYDLSATNSIFGHSIKYDWVNYSTSIGIDIFYTKYFYPNSSPVFKESLSNNQIEYTTTIMKSSPYGFYSVTE